MNTLHSRDRHPALAIKKACLARSGVYYYTRDEMITRGFTPKGNKDVYAEYRPPEVLLRAKDRFAFAAVTKEHTPEETTSENFRMQASGVVGDNITTERMADGNIGIYGNIAFYTKDAYDYYKQGHRETSADYRSSVAVDETGRYDFILKDIISVNGVVITAQGRGGSNVRVLDSKKNSSFGGIRMGGQKGVLSFLGIGKAKHDEDFKLSKVVLDGAKSLHSLDSAGKEALVAKIMDDIQGLGDSKNKNLLVGAVKDALTDPIEALKQEEKVARVIDGLYDACASMEDEEVSTLLKSLAEGKTQDAGGKPGKKEEYEENDGNKDKKDEGSTKDSKVSIEDMFKRFEERVSDSMGTLIDKKLKEALGLKDDKTADTTKGKTQDSIELDDEAREDGSFILDGTFL